MPSLTSTVICRRVTLREDEMGEIQLQNLSRAPVTSQEEALELLFLGDTNRAICETPMNPVSSRSHCIFTIGLESRAEVRTGGTAFTAQAVCGLSSAFMLPALRAFTGF